LIRIVWNENFGRVKQREKTGNTACNKLAMHGYMNVKFEFVVKVVRLSSLTLLFNVLCGLVPRM